MAQYPQYTQLQSTEASSTCPAAHLYRRQPASAPTGLLPPQSDVIFLAASASQLQQPTDRSIDDAVIGLTEIN